MSGSLKLCFGLEKAGMNVLYMWEKECKNTEPVLVSVPSVCSRNTSLLVCRLRNHLASKYLVFSSGLKDKLTMIALPGLKVDC